MNTIQFGSYVEDTNGLTFKAMSNEQAIHEGYDVDDYTIVVETYNGLRRFARIRNGAEYSRFDRKWCAMVHRVDMFNIDTVVRNGVIYGAVGAIAPRGKVRRDALISV